MGFRDLCHVNRKLLPYKLHFFFFYGGCAGVMPFMPLIAKQLGINATAVGVGYSMIPVFIFLSNPFFGILVDYFQNIKIFLIFLIVCSWVSYFSVLFLPPLHSAVEDETYVQIYHLFDSEPFVNLSVTFKRTCIENILEENTDCKLVFDEVPICDNIESFPLNLTDPLRITYNATLSAISNAVSDKRQWISFYVNEISILDPKCIINSSIDLQCTPSIQQCSFNEDSPSIFSTHQFWAFISLAVIGGMTSISTMTLSSVACNEAIGTKVEAYGRQRLFGTISWGLICSLAGILNDISNSSERSFAPGFYLMAGFFTVDIIILCLTRIPKANYSTSMCTDLGNIVSSAEILVFSFGIVFIGIMNALISIYEFWYLQDMGASQTLLGLTVAVQCLVGETPFLFFAGWFVNKLGHFLCLVCVLAGFAVRMILYSILKDPWLVLPIDILHGVTFGIYHGAMTSFAKAKAPAGMEATLLGILSGLYDGLGYGIGSFIGGIGLDNLGPRRTFFSASMASTGCLLLFLVASFLRRSPVPKRCKVAPVANEITC